MKYGRIVPLKVLPDLPRDFPVTKQERDFWRPKLAGMSNRGASYQLGIGPKELAQVSVLIRWGLEVWDIAQDTPPYSGTGIPPTIPLEENT